MRRIDEIIIHCSATPEGKNFKAADIRRWHTAKPPVGRGWSDIGYHYVILLDGTVEHGRPVDRIGAHCSGRNENSIGVCLIGGCAADGKTSKDTRTEAQKASLLNLVRELQNRYRIPSSGIHGHNEFANKACPSFDVQAWKRRNNL